MKNCWRKTRRRKGAMAKAARGIEVPWFPWTDPESEREAGAQRRPYERFRLFQRTSTSNGSSPSEDAARYRPWTLWLCLEMTAHGRQDRVSAPANGRGILPQQAQLPPQALLGRRQ